MKTRNIVMFAEGGMPKTKLAMLKWLNSHDKYQGEYEIGIRIRNLNRNAEEETAMYLALDNQFIWDRFVEALEEFREDYPCYSINLEGRSNGHAVLCTAGLEYLAEDEPDMDCTFKSIRERVKLVRDFDRAVNAAVLVFLELALDAYRKDKQREDAMEGLTVEKCEYVKASQLVPKSLEPFFRIRFHVGGFTVHKLVTAGALANEIRMTEWTPDAERRAFVAKLEAIAETGDVLIDLEN